METRQKPQGPRNDEHPPKEMKSLQEASEPIAEMDAKFNEWDALNSEGGSNGMPLATFLGKGLQGKNLQKERKNMWQLLWWGKLERHGQLVGNLVKGFKLL